MVRKIISIIIAINFLLYLFSCTTTGYLKKEELLKENEISVIYVNTTDKQELKLKDPILEGKVLSGYLESATYTEIDTSQIETLGIKKLNKGSTIFFSAVGVAAAILFITSQSRSSSGDCNT